MLCYGDRQVDRWREIDVVLWRPIDRQTEIDVVL